MNDLNHCECECVNCGNVIELPFFTITQEAANYLNDNEWTNDRDIDGSINWYCPECKPEI